MGRDRLAGDRPFARRRGLRPRDGGGPAGTRQTCAASPIPGVSLPEPTRVERGRKLLKPHQRVGLTSETRYSRFAIIVAEQNMTERLRYDEDKAFLLADDAATVARIVRTVPPDRLRATKFDQWSAVEIIGHLADAAEIFADRVQRCLDEERPQVASYDQDAVAAERRNDVRDPMELSRRLSAAHSRIIHLLQRPGAAARPAVHSAWGEVDAGHFGAYQAAHSHGHTSELSAAFPPTV